MNDPSHIKSWVDYCLYQPTIMMPPIHNLHMSQSIIWSR